MLANVADEQYPVLRPEPCEKVPHLVGACQTRFINKLEVTPARRIRFGRVCKELLQCFGDDASVIELARGARGWGKAAYCVALGQLPPALGREFFGQLVLGRADLIEQFVERFRRQSLSCGQGTKHIDQEQADAKNFGE